MRTVVINARFLTQATTGVQRYAAELVKHLDALIGRGEVGAGGWKFVLLAPRQATQDLGLANIVVKRTGYLRGHLWEQLELPLRARGALLVGLCNAGPLLKRDQVVIVHDAAVFAVPHAYTWAFRTWYRVLLRGLGRVARTIITDSSFSKGELMKYCRIGEARIRVIHPGQDHVRSIVPDEAILRRHGLDGRRYVLVVGSMDPRKNLRSLARALETARHVGFDVVIAGGARPAVFGRADQGLLSGAKYLGYVSDAELKALYGHAACFVYPSSYEGFGLPPLEAMACGCPTVVSRAASLPEVCGDAALYCDPDSPEDIAEKIARVMSDPALSAELRHKGPERAALYGWERCARETARVIAEVSELTNAEGTAAR